MTGEGKKLKKVRCKKQYGVWYYEIVKPNDYNDLDGPIYCLYDSNKNPVYDFSCYGDMKYYIETGKLI